MTFLLSRLDAERARAERATGILSEVYIYQERDHVARGGEWVDVPGNWHCYLCEEGDAPRGSLTREGIVHAESCVLATAANPSTIPNGSRTAADERADVIALLNLHVSQARDAQTRLRNPVMYEVSLEWDARINACMVAISDIESGAHVGAAKKEGSGG